jgi:hypothetical protein
MNDPAELRGSAALPHGVFLRTYPANLCFFSEADVSRHSVEQKACKPARAPTERSAGIHVLQLAQQIRRLSLLGESIGAELRGTPGEFIILAILRMNWM